MRIFGLFYILSTCQTPNTNSLANVYQRQLDSYMESEFDEAKFNIGERESDPFNQGSFFKESSGRETIKGGKEHNIFEDFDAEAAFESTREERDPQLEVVQDEFQTRQDGYQQVQPFYNEAAYQPPEPAYQPQEYTYYQPQAPATYQVPNYYSPSPAYAQSPGYEPELSYTSAAGYEPQPAYGPPPSFAPEPAYESKPAYGPLPAYAPVLAYEPEPYNGPPAPAYEPEPVYGPPAPAYEPEPVYGPPVPAYEPEPVYSPPPAYAPTPTYGSPAPSYLPARPPPKLVDPTYHEPHPSEEHAVEHHGVRGIPGKDYPTYSDIPLTRFACASVPVRPGMYADVEAQCQVYRVCEDGRHGPAGAGFLCPNGTLFNQAHFECDYWYNVDCGQTLQLYDLNLDPYKNPFGEPHKKREAPASEFFQEATQRNEEKAHFSHTPPYQRSNSQASYFAQYYGQEK